MSFLQKTENNIVPIQRHHWHAGASSLAAAAQHRGRGETEVRRKAVETTHKELGVSCLVFGRAARGQRTSATSAIRAPRCPHFPSSSGSTFHSADSLISTSACLYAIGESAARNGVPSPLLLHANLKRACRSRSSCCCSFRAFIRAAWASLSICTPFSSNSSCM
jgi:hypothetical protein